MNFDARWCDLSVRDYLVIERAWGWSMGLLQLAVVGGGAFIARWAWKRWRSRRPPVPPVDAAGPLPYAQIFSCGCGAPESHWINACPFPGPPLEQTIREWREQQERIAAGLRPRCARCGELGHVRSQCVELAESGHPLPQPTSEPSTEPEAEKPPE